MVQIDPKTAELVWPGKYGEDGKLRPGEPVSLPFQVIESVNESRATREARKAPRQSGLFDFYALRDSEGWRNKLIWGDNLLVMGSLVDNLAGKIDLIYIDPPFATGADFSVTVPIGESGEEVVKEQSAIEEKAYRDTWGKGLSSYLHMIYQRLTLIRELLSDRGSLYIHLDDHVSHYVKVIADEIFGVANFRNEIAWQRTNAHNLKMRYYARVHDVILFYTKSDQYIWNQTFGEHTPEQLDRYEVDEEGFLYTGQDLTVTSRSATRKDLWRGAMPGPGRAWAASLEEREKLWEAGRILTKKDGSPRLDGYKVYLHEKVGPKVTSVWRDIKRVGNTSNERLNYATQKPTALLERIISASSDEGSIVADFFAGSGTTLAVAEQLGRRWVGADLGRYAIHTSRKRLLDIPECKPFEILNLGKYERKYWQTSTFGAKDSNVAVFQYLEFILNLYNSDLISGLSYLHGKKGKAMVHIGAVDAPVTIDQISGALQECIELRQSELHVLGWDWEMGLYDLMTEEAGKHGISLLLLQIPREVMEEQFTGKESIRFFELAYMDASVKAADSDRERTFFVGLEDFVIPNTELIPEEVQSQITSWSDFIDYWAVDWDFQNDTFVQGFVSYRTNKNRRLSLTSDHHTYEGPGTYRVLVKVIDIFGNDTTQAIELEVL